MKRCSWLIILIILSASRCNLLDDIRSTAAGLAGQERLFTTVAAPDLRPSDATAAFLPNGDILIVFKSSAADAGADGGKDVFVTRSSDRGRSWKSPETAFRPAWDFRNPAIAAVPDGPILLVFGWQDADAPDLGHGDPGFFVSHSPDNGVSFSTPRLVRTPQAGRVATSGSAVALEDGSVLLPLTAQGGIRLAVSRDAGESWKIGPAIAEDAASTPRNPSLVRLPDRRLFCLFEQGTVSPRLMTCESSDNGVTWSRPVDTGILGSRPSCAALSGGVLACAFTDRWPSGISLMRSFDGGGRWECMEQLSAPDSRGAIAPMSGDTLLAVCGPDQAKAGAGLRAAVFAEAAPGPPAGLSGSYKHGKGNHLRWNSMRGAVYYSVYRDTSPLADPPPAASRLATAHSAGFSDVSVDSGKTYFYRVTAVRSENAPVPGAEGRPSAELSIVAAEKKK
ncbi:MAG: sialidase family protein [bacterium]|nr:sialidase family protein [bacterium]